MRCGKCGKVLLAKPSEKRKIAKCPKCKAIFAIPSISELAERKKTRTVVSGNDDFLAKLPDSLTIKTAEPLTTVAYTESPPVQFALQREKQAPLLDLSEDGLSFYMVKSDQTVSLKQGTSFWVEIDFPVLLKPVYAEVVLRWSKPLENEVLLQLGVEFANPSKDFKQVLSGLIDFILSRPEAWESV